jgi:hypothetical protein
MIKVCQWLTTAPLVEEYMYIRNIQMPSLLSNGSVLSEKNNLVQRWRPSWISHAHTKWQLHKIPFPLRRGGIDTTLKLYDKSLSVTYDWLVVFFSPGALLFSTNKTDCHDIRTYYWLPYDTTRTLYSFGSERNHSYSYRILY